VFNPQPFENPLRRMPLLGRRRFVGFQDRINHRNQRPELRPLRGLGPHIAGRRRIPVIAANAPELVARLADKAQRFELLHTVGFKLPRTIELSNNILRGVAPPCIIKPSVESGGSAYVFYARNTEEVQLYGGSFATVCVPSHRSIFHITVANSPSGSCLIWTIAFLEQLP
jgi:hypothetical protein